MSGGGSFPPQKRGGGSDPPCFCAKNFLHNMPKKVLGLETDPKIAFFTCFFFEESAKLENFAGLLSCSDLTSKCCGWKPRLALGLPPQPDALS